MDRRRIRESVRGNIRYYALLGLIGVAVVFGLLVSKTAYVLFHHSTGLIFLEQYQVCFPLELFLPIHMVLFRSLPFWELDWSSFLDCTITITSASSNLLVYFVNVFPLRLLILHTPNANSLMKTGFPLKCKLFLLNWIFVRLWKVPNTVLLLKLLKLYVIVIVIVVVILF